MVSSNYHQPHHYYGPLTTAQINALTGMSTGDTVYDLTDGLQKIYDGSAWIRKPQSNNMRFTAEGGLAILLTNKTGAASVKGELVKADTANDNAIIHTAADDQECIGAFYESDIADGSAAWVVISGIVEVMIKDGTAATHGNWVKTSDAAGRADATLLAPPGGGVVQLDQHMQEVGHCIKSEGSGSDVLARIVMHFN